MERAYAVHRRRRARRRPGVLLDAARLVPTSSTGNIEQAPEWIERALDLAEALYLPEALVPRLDTQGDASPRAAPPRGGARSLPSSALETALAHDSARGRRRSTQSLRPRLAARPLRRFARATWSSRSRSRAGSATGERVVRAQRDDLRADMLGRWDEALARLDEIPERCSAPTSHCCRMSGSARDLFAPWSSSTGRGTCSRLRALEERRTTSRPRAATEAARRGSRLAERDYAKALASRRARLRDAHHRSGSPSRASSSDCCTRSRRRIELGDRGPRPTSCSRSSSSSRRAFGRRSSRRSRTASGPPRRRRPGRRRLISRAAAAQLRELELPFHLAVVSARARRMAGRSAGDRTTPTPLLAEARRRSTRSGRAVAGTGAASPFPRGASQSRFAAG